MQKTLKTSVTFEGITLHEGKHVRLTIMPGGINSGIVFIRDDLETHNEIPATWKAVVHRPFCTLIQNNYGASVSTIEHLMAAFSALDIDNVRIHINGPEVPVMDGSSFPFVSAFTNAGIVEQSAPRTYCTVLKTVRVEKEWGFVELAPSHAFILDVHMTFQERNDMKEQHYTFHRGRDDFNETIAKARTYGFFEDIEALRKAGFIKGGTLDNAVVVQDGHVLNPEGLRYEDECVRHKVLDAMGDLYLMNAPLMGKYTAKNGGHEMNNQLLHALFSDPKAYRMEGLEPTNENWEPLTRSILSSFGLF